MCSNHRDALIKDIVDTAEVKIGVTVTVDSRHGLSSAQYLAAMAGLGIEQSEMRDHVPLHQTYVNRIQLPSGFVDARADALRNGWPSRSGADWFLQFPQVERRLDITAKMLYERHTRDLTVTQHKDLRTVASIAVFLDEAQLFAIEWCDGSEPTVFASNAREVLIPVLLDQVQTVKECAVPVLPDLTPKCLKIVGLSSPKPTHATADAVDEALEGEMFEQLLNAACLVHPFLCQNRLTAFVDSLPAPKPQPVGVDVSVGEKGYAAAATNTFVGSGVDPGFDVAALGEAMGDVAERVRFGAAQTFSSVKRGVQVRVRHCQ